MGNLPQEEIKYRRPSVSLCTLLLSALASWQRIDRARSLLGRLLLLGQVLDDLLLLGLETLLSALACLLCLGATSFSLIAVGQRGSGVHTGWYQLFKGYAHTLALHSSLIKLDNRLSPISCTTLQIFQHDSYSDFLMNTATAH